MLYNAASIVTARTGRFSRPADPAPGPVVDAAADGRPDGSGVVAVDGANWRWKAAPRDTHLQARHRIAAPTSTRLHSRWRANSCLIAAVNAATAGASSPSEPRSEPPPPSAIPEPSTSNNASFCCFCCGRAAIIDALYTVRDAEGRARLRGGVGEVGEWRWGWAGAVWRAAALGTSVAERVHRPRREQRRRLLGEELRL